MTITIHDFTLPETQWHVLDIDPITMEKLRETNAKTLALNWPLDEGQDVTLSYKIKRRDWKRCRVWLREMNDGEA